MHTDHRPLLPIHTCYISSLGEGTAHSHCLSLLLPPRFVPLWGFFGRSFLVSPLGGVSPATVISDLCRAGRGEVGQEIPGQIEAVKVETKGIASALYVKQAPLLLAATNVLLSLLPCEVESLPETLSAHPSPPLPR